MSKHSNNKSKSVTIFPIYWNTCIGIIVLLLLICYWEIICFIAIIFVLGYITVRFKNEIKNALISIGLYFKDIYLKIKK